MKKYFIVFVLLFPMILQSQTKFRSGVFLHHSTGNNIWGNNGSSVTVPKEIVKYNSSHGFSGDQAVSMDEMWWPSGDNEWYTWYRIFKNEESSDDIRPILNSNKIVVIKSCFPSSSMESYGAAADTNDLYKKSVYNYKFLWRNIVKIMKGMPDHFFVIWTNAPLVAGQTNDSEAALSDLFCTWAKDTLAAGLDTQFGSFPQNVYVFDFFHKLADSSGKLPGQYAEDPYDSHPNIAATELVAPQFVTEIFDAAINYESIYSSISKQKSRPEVFDLGQNFPNPFNMSTQIPFRVKEPCMVKLLIYDVHGRFVSKAADGFYQTGDYKSEFNARGLGSGMCFYKIQIGDFVSSKKMILLK